MLFDAKSKIERYLRKNPQVKTIVVAGSYGRKSAIRCIGMILGQALTVTMGINRNADPDVVVLDYNSMVKYKQRKQKSREKALKCIMLGAMIDMTVKVNEGIH